MEVLAFRLANGDEILGRYNLESQVGDDVVVLEKVRHLIVQRTPEGLGVTLMPWVFSNIDVATRISKAHIMASFAPSADTIVSYQQQTTGIALASA